MPPVIMKTDKYFEKSYRFFKIIIPIIIFAISDPWINEKTKQMIKIQ